MPDFPDRSPDPAVQPEAYVAFLLQALGPRDPLEVLTETPAALRAAVSGLTREQDGIPELPGRWSVRHVVQHLTDSDLVGGFRFRMILAHDAPELPGYDQDLWAQRLRYEDTDVPSALEEFSTLRRASLRLLRRAAPADWRRVLRHAERGEEMLAHLIRLHAGHDLVHLRQISRIRRAIGSAATAPPLSPPEAVE
jgi:hypothetical protein